MTAAVVSGLLAGFGIAVPVGAIGVLLISLSAKTSLRIGVAAGLGAATVDGTYALLAIAGGAGLARAIRTVAGPLRWASGVVLVFLAIWTAASAVRGYRSPAHARARAISLNTPLRAYTALVGLTALNPLTVVYFAALVMGRQASASFTAAQAGVFVLGVFAASAGWQTILASGGALIGRLLNSQRGKLITALVSGLLIMVLALGILSR